MWCTRSRTCACFWSGWSLVPARWSRPLSRSILQIDERFMRKWNFSIRTALLLTTLAAVMLTVDRSVSDSARSFCTSIKNNDGRAIIPFSEEYDKFVEENGVNHLEFKTRPPTPIERCLLQRTIVLNTEICIPHTYGRGYSQMHFDTVLVKRFFGHEVQSHVERRGFSFNWIPRKPLAPNRKTRDNRTLIRSGEARLVGWSRSMLYSGFNVLPRSSFWSAYFNGRSDNLDVMSLCEFKF